MTDVTITPPVGEAVFDGLTPTIVTGTGVVMEPPTGEAVFDGLAPEIQAFSPSFWMEKDGIIFRELSFESLFPGKKSDVQKITIINNLDAQIEIILTPAVSQSNPQGSDLDTYLSHYLSPDNINYSNGPLELVIPASGEQDFYTYYHPPSTGKVGWKQWLLDTEIDVPILEGWGYVTWFIVTGEDEEAINAPYTLDEPITIEYVPNLMEEDFKDIRFALADHTILKHEIISKTDGDEAEFLVQLPADTIPATPGTVTVYVYSGNPDAEDISDPTTSDIYRLNEEFLGTSLNMDRWEVSITEPSGSDFNYSVNNYLEISGKGNGSWVPSQGLFRSKWPIQTVGFGVGLDMGGFVRASSNPFSYAGFGIFKSDDTPIVRVGYHSPNNVRREVYLISESVWTNVAAGWIGSGTNTVYKDIGTGSSVNSFNIALNGSIISVYMGGSHIADTTISSTIDYLGLFGYFPDAITSTVTFDNILEDLVPPTVGPISTSWVNAYPIPVKADILYQPTDLPELDVERRFGVRIGGTLFE